MIANVRRGAEFDELEFTAVDGHVLRLLAEGLTEDERRRVRETVLTWLVDSGISLVTEGRP